MIFVCQLIEFCFPILRVEFFDEDVIAVFGRRSCQGSLKTNSEPVRHILVVKNENFTCVRNIVIIELVFSSILALCVRDAGKRPA